MPLSPPVDSLCLVLRIACRIDDAIGGTIHLISEDGCTLIAQHNLPDDFNDAFRTPSAGDGSTISQVCHDLRRVVVRDVRTDPSFAPYRALAAKTGVAAIQSTPMSCDETDVHGVLTTCFSRPHHPDKTSLELLDFCASIAVKILVAAELEEAIKARRAGQPGVQPDVMNAASALRMLLPACERAPAPDLLLATDRKLTIVLDALMRRAPELPSPAIVEPMDELQCNG